MSWYTATPRFLNDSQARQMPTATSSRTVPSSLTPQLSAPATPTPQYRGVGTPFTHSELQAQNRPHPNNTTKIRHDIHHEDLFRILLNDRESLHAIVNRPRTPLPLPHSEGHATGSRLSDLRQRRPTSDNPPILNSGRPLLRRLATPNFQSDNESESESGSERETHTDSPRTLAESKRTQGQRVLPRSIKTEPNLDTESRYQSIWLDHILQPILIKAMPPRALSNTTSKNAKAKPSGAPPNKSTPKTKVAPKMSPFTTRRRPRKDTSSATNRVVKRRQSTSEGNEPPRKTRRSQRLKESTAETKGGYFPGDGSSADRPINCESSDDELFMSKTSKAAPSSSLRIETINPRDGTTISDDHGQPTPISPTFHKARRPLEDITDPSLRITQLKDALELVKKDQKSAENKLEAIRAENMQLKETLARKTAVEKEIASLKKELEQTAKSSQALKKENAAQKMQIQTLKEQGGNLPSPTPSAPVSLAAPSPPTSLENRESQRKDENVRRTYVILKGRYDNLHAAATNIVQSMDPRSVKYFEDFGKNVKALNAAMADESKAPAANGEKAKVSEKEDEVGRGRDPGGVSMNEGPG